MSLTKAEERRALLVEAEEGLSGAYRALGDAADCLRHQGFPDALNAVGEAKTAINQAKDEIADYLRGPR